MKKISYKKLQELVVSLRSTDSDLCPSVCFNKYYVGLRLFAPATVLSSTVLSKIARCFRSVDWFIEQDSYNHDYYFISFDKDDLK